MEAEEEVEEEVEAEGKAEEEEEAEEEAEAREEVFFRERRQPDWKNRVTGRGYIRYRFYPDFYSLSLSFSLWIFSL